jgi:hypothetical protein
MNDAWLISTDEEMWSSTSEFATREEAIAHGPDEDGLEPGATYWVGRYWVGRKASVIDVKDSSLFSADSFIETLGMLAFDQVDLDLSDGWPDDPGKEAKAELERDVAKVMRAWIEKHDLSPSFFTIRDTSDHTEPDYPTECEHCEAEPTVVFERDITVDGVVTGEIRVFSCSDCASQVESDTGAQHMKLDDWRVQERLLAWKDQEAERAAKKNRKAYGDFDLLGGAEKL